MSDIPEEDTESRNDTALLRVPACDQCKGRKIKCDRNVPCSSCTASKITCRTTKRQPEKRQRILISKNYGEEIANVNKQLADLSRTVQALVSSKQGSPSASSTPPVVNIITPSSSSLLEHDPAFEGDSSFASHSKSIADAFGAALSHDTNTKATPATSPVKRLLEDVSAVPKHAPVTVASSPVSTSQSIPPMATVLRLIKLASTETQRFFLEYPSTSLEKFSTLCQNIYFPTREYTVANWIFLNVCLFYLFRDLDKKFMPLLEISKTEQEAYVELCSGNALSSIQDVRVTAEPSLDLAEALSQAAAIAMEHAQSSLAWKTVSFAARMCLDLGLHRQVSRLSNPETRREKIVFWFIYALDKGLALSFGRTPTIHDYDMTTEYPRVPEDLDGPFVGYYLGWLDFARVQGDTYEQLFCVAAQRMPLNTRVARAHALAARCLELRSRLVSFRATEFEDYMQEHSLSTEVVVYSLLTLIYRTLPPPENAHALQFSDDCVTAAREALRCLSRAWKEIQPRDEQAWALWVNWTVLFVPFVPFIVVFGNTIACNSHQDLQLMEDAVRTFQGLSELAPAANKLRNACEKFCQIAVAHLAPGTGRGIQPESTSVSSVGNNNIVADATLRRTTEPAYVDFQPLSDFSMYEGDWNDMLNEWDLGLGVENAREMTGWLMNQSAATTSRR